MGGDVAVGVGVDDESGRREWVCQPVSLMLLH